MKLFQMSSIMLLMISTMISVSATSWLGAWIGLEINLMSIMPILILNKNIRTSESSIKYFITQIMASIILVAFILLIMMNYPNYLNGCPQPYMGILVSLMLKMGSAPLHFWLPSVMEGTSWFGCSIIMTWQKIIPMTLLSFIIQLNWFLMIFIISSALIGAIGGFNQTNLKKIMAFSSINHGAWMIIALTLNEFTWLIYFLSYSVISLSINFLFLNNNLSHLYQMWSLMSKTPIIKMAIMCSLFSLGGLPPFLGFLPKLIIITKLIFFHQIITATLVMSSLITLFFYSRIIFSALSLSYPISLLKIHQKKMFFIEISTMFISLSALTFIPYLNLT